MKHYTQGQRRNVISYYSNGENACKCCGLDVYEFLCVDHINNDGAEHRKQIGGSSELIKWIIKNNYPSGFQILCQNCNVGKSRNNGVCPHEKLNGGKGIDKKLGAVYISGVYFTSIPIGEVIKL